MPFMPFHSFFFLLLFYVSFPICNNKQLWERVSQPNEQTNKPRSNCRRRRKEEEGEAEPAAKRRKVVCHSLPLCKQGQTGRKTGGKEGEEEEEEKLSFIKKLLRRERKKKRGFISLLSSLVYTLFFLSFFVCTHVNMVYRARLSLRLKTVTTGIVATKCHYLSKRWISPRAYLPIINIFMCKCMKFSFLSLVSWGDL